MKKGRYLLVAAVFLAALVLAGCVQKKGGNPAAEPVLQEPEKALSTQKENPAISSEIDYDGWQTYLNEKYSYTVKYPGNWYFMKDACCPPPPAFINLNSYSSQKAEYAAHQTEKGVQGVDISCLYEGKIDAIGEVQLLRKEGKSNKLVEINGFEAVRFEENMVPGDASRKIVSYYIVDGTQGCRAGYTGPCEDCEKVIVSFVFK